MKKLIYFIVAILLLAAVPVTVYFVGKQQELRSKAAPATTLSFTPATLSKGPNEQFTLNILINTGQNSVAAAKLSISFDATKLEAMSITNGALAPKITASGTVSPGLATITVAAESTAQPIQGTGTIALLRMQTKDGTTGPITIKFDPTTFVSGLNESANVLTTSGTASITITGDSQATTTISPTLAPTAIPTGSITPTITTTPPVEPTVEPTIEPTVEAQATASAETNTGIGGATGDAMPVSGSPLPTVLSLALALGCMIIGGFLRIAPEKKL